MGTTVDIAETAGAIELKGGSKMIESSYQLRLQTYRALKTDTPLTIRTTWPVNPTFDAWLRAVGRHSGQPGYTGRAVKLRYTRHQVARGSRPDAEVGNKLYLLKKVPILHATYQVRLLAFRAQREQKELVIRGPVTLKAGPSLRDLMAELKGIIRLERSDR